VEFNEQFFKEMGRSAGVTALTVAAGERVLAAAIANAPRDQGGYIGGLTLRIKYQDRVVALVVGTDWKTMILEAKTGNLVRALKSAGKSG
jgi:hypothetical protein